MRYEARNESMRYETQDESVRHEARNEPVRYETQDESVRYEAWHEPLQSMLYEASPLRADSLALYSPGRFAFRGFFFGD